MSLVGACLPAVLLALVTTTVAGENECDLVGVKGSESKRELALLKRLEPLANYRYVGCGRQCCTSMCGCFRSGVVLSWSPEGFLSSSPG